MNYSASLLQQCFRNPNQVMIVSNACISGISAAIVASRYIQAGLYKHVLVIGCDVVSRFVLSGFNSFLAISKNGCKPFDIDRDGVVLGEACGAILLSSEHTSEIVVAGGPLQMMQITFQDLLKLGRNWLIVYSSYCSNHLFHKMKSVLYLLMARLPNTMMKWSRKRLRWQD
ncbi:MAG: hypothetical protein IPI22_01745 [Bacteroidetes bacterium]|nr:hypothetical protein [Bacteroidota bacterium]